MEKCSAVGMINLVCHQANKAVCRKIDAMCQIFDERATDKRNKKREISIAAACDENMHEEE